MQHVLPIPALDDLVQVSVRQHLVDDHLARGVVAALDRELHDVAGAHIGRERADIPKHVLAVLLALRGRRNLDEVLRETRFARPTWIT